MREFHRAIGRHVQSGAITRSVVSAITIALVAGACSAEAPAPGSTARAPVAASMPTGAPEISQPPVPGDLPLASQDARVDLTMPSFSDPTGITNPLFPVSDQASVLMLGHVEGEPFRTEVTLLPGTRIVEWEGQQVETVVSQYVAFLGGSIQEVAYDLYAQADDGSVWYFGEDVFDFRDGTIVVTEGTWLAGRDGPAAMIMPADPQVGDVYRPENAPGFVFEEVTVRSTSEPLRGPLGPIESGMVASELHMDGGRERKIFAPGYGEFSTAADGDVEALAMAVPTDSSDGNMPEELATLADEALATYEAAGRQGWRRASSNIEAMEAAWASLPADEVPRLVGPVLVRSLRQLARSVETRDVAGAQDHAIEIGRSSFDLQLRYRPVAEIDLARMDLWAAQLIADEAAGDEHSVAADAFALDYTRDRILASLDATTLTRINSALGLIQVAVADDEPAAAAHAAARLRRILAG